jgi:hypothetical protein
MKDALGGFNLSFLRRRVLKQLSSGMRHHVISWKLTNVSDAITASIIALMMEAVITSEASVNLYETIRCKHSSRQSCVDTGILN